MVTNLHLLSKYVSSIMSYCTGMNNMLFDGHTLDQYDEDELAEILERENKEKEELAARLKYL